MRSDDGVSLALNFPLQPSGEGGRVTSIYIALAAFLKGGRATCCPFLQHVFLLCQIRNSVTPLADIM